MRREFRLVNTERAETWRMSFKVGARRPNGPGARRPNRPGARRPSRIGARSTRAALGTRHRRPGRTPRTCSHTPSRGAVPPRDEISLRNNLDTRSGFSVFSGRNGGGGGFPTDNTDPGFARYGFARIRLGLLGGGTKTGLVYRLKECETLEAFDGQG